MNHEFSDELLSAYLDDELSPEERARVETALDADHELRRTCDELRLLSNTLQAMPAATGSPDWSATVMERALAATASSPAPTLEKRPGHQRAAWSLVAGALAVVAAVVLITVNLPREGQLAGDRDVAQATEDVQDSTSADLTMTEAGAPEMATSTQSADALPTDSTAKEGKQAEAKVSNAPKNQPTTQAKALPPTPAANLPGPRGGSPRSLNPGDMAADDMAADAAPPAPNEAVSAAARGMDQKRFLKVQEVTTAGKPQAIKLVLRRGEDSNAELAKLLQLSTVELAQLRGQTDDILEGSPSTIANATDLDKNAPRTKEKSRKVAEWRRKHDELILATLTREQLEQADEVFILESAPDALRGQRSLAAPSPQISAQPLASRNLPAGPTQRTQRKNGESDRAPRTGDQQADTPASPGTESAPAAQPFSAEPVRVPSREPDNIAEEKSSERVAANQLRKIKAPQVVRVLPRDMLARYRAATEQRSSPAAAPESPAAQDSDSLSQLSTPVQTHPMIVIVQYEDSAPPPPQPTTEPTNE